MGDTTNGTRRLDLGNGEWVLIKPMTIDALEAFSDAETNVAPAIRAVKEACVEAHFANDEPIGKQPVETLSRIMSQLNAVEDEVALPPANGQS